VDARVDRCQECQSLRRRNEFMHGLASGCRPAHYGIFLLPSIFWDGSDTDILNFSRKRLFDPHLEDSLTGCD
jgi:hypothetical protein